MTTDQSTLPPAPAGVPAGSTGPGEPTAAARRGGINPIVIMVGVGLLMFAAIALAQTFKQGSTADIRGGAVSGTGQLVASGLSVGEPMKVGAPAPDFTLTDLGGNEVALSSLRGRPVLLNFWATWCPPCRTEMPEFEDMHRRYPELAVVGVNLREEPAHVEKFVANAGYTWTFLLDRTGGTSLRYALAALPSTFFIDRDGVIRDIRVGGMSRKEIEQRVAKLLEAA